MNQLIMLLVLFAALFALAYAALNFVLVRKLKEGNDRMQEIAAAIREGANAFIRYEYKIVAIIGVCIAAVLGIVISWETMLAFLLGALMSSLAGLVGMKIATYANVRVTNAANESRNTGKTLKVAFRGGSVMGLAGMLIFIPLCSVAYTLLRENVLQRLHRRRIPEEKLHPPAKLAENTFVEHGKAPVVDIAADQPPESADRPKAENAPETADTTPEAETAPEDGPHDGAR